MSSFDVVSEVDLQEVSNAVDQANREIGTRFDFKGIDASFVRSEGDIRLTADSDFRLGQMLDILIGKLVKRDIDVRALDVGAAVPSGKQVYQVATVRQGLDKDLARRIVKIVKEQKSKVQAAIQGEKVRITGKKRDDLQKIIALLKDSDLDMPLQFDNFRD